MSINKSNVFVFICVMIFLYIFSSHRKLKSENLEEFRHEEGKMKCKRMPGLIMETYDRSLCYLSYKKFQVPSYRKCQCPQKPIVTAFQLGQLGNQFLEYIFVAGVAKKTGREAYLPSCTYNFLSGLFKNLSVPPMSYISHCSVNKYPLLLKTNEELLHAKGSIAIPDYALGLDYVGADIMMEIVRGMQIKDELLERSQRILSEVSKGKGKRAFVGVHVRRTDFAGYLKTVYNMELLGSEYFLRHMKYFRKKYGEVIFVLVSDDPDWCERELGGGGDVVIVRDNSPEQDVAIMASCNHSLIDYGTFGFLGALLAGGETIVYNLHGGFEYVPNFIPSY